MKRWGRGDVMIKEDGGFIGGGTFAKVMVAKTVGSSVVKIAVKVLAREMSPCGNQDKYIQRELGMSKLCAGHPNVINILGTLTSLHMTYILTPLASTDVATLVERKPLTEPEAGSIVGQFMAAAEHVHSLGVIHRDLKPANLLITSDNTVRLADFGVAKKLEEGEGTMTGVCGTKPYLSPEQVSGRCYSTKADMWAAGVTVFEILHGYTAFGGPLSTLAPVSAEGSMDIGSDDGLGYDDIESSAYGGITPPGGGMEMSFNDYDIGERKRIRAGKFVINPERVGYVGADFLEKLLKVDPKERMSAMEASDHPWLGGLEYTSLARKASAAHLARCSAERQEEKAERLKRCRRVKTRIPLFLRSASPSVAAAETPSPAAKDNTSRQAVNCSPPLDMEACVASAAQEPTPCPAKYASRHAMEYVSLSVKKESAPRVIVEASIPAVEDSTAHTAECAPQDPARASTSCTDENRSHRAKEGSAYLAVEKAYLPAVEESSSVGAVYDAYHAAVGSVPLVMEKLSPPAKKESAPQAAQGSSLISENSSADVTRASTADHTLEDFTAIDDIDTCVVPLTGKDEW